MLNILKKKFSNIFFFGFEKKIIKKKHTQAKKKQTKKNCVDAIYFDWN